MIFQLGTALLDACVLSVLSLQDAYGYTITQTVQRKINVAESTLYPVLKRLRQDSLLTTYDLPYQGRNRRYYSITNEGRTRLYEYQSEWTSYKDKVDSILFVERNEFGQPDDDGQVAISLKKPESGALRVRPEEEEA